MPKIGEFSLDKNPAWKGGRVIASNGYVLICLPDHPDCDVRGYIYEHRLVAEKKIGRRLLPKEQVHHLDGNKKNNTPENLEVLADKQHKRVHAKRNDLRPLGAENLWILCSCGCGNSLLKYDNKDRPRTMLLGHNRRKGNGKNN